MLKMPSSSFGNIFAARTGPRFLGVFLLASFLFTGCTDPKPYRESRFMMGTLVDLVLYTQPDAGAKAAGRAFEGMLRIEWVARSSEEGSPLFEIRQGRGARIEGDLSRILDTAVNVSRAASGAFDPTLGALVHLWGFGREDPTLPEPGEIKQALEQAGLDRVSAGNCCPEGVAVWLDLGGVAKGYAVDEAVRSLRESGVRAGIVNAGGDLRSFGKRPGRGYWKIGVQDPNSPQELAGILEIREAAVATSGDYQRYFEKNGTRYHHILNPATGYPAQSGLRGTTVVAPDCATADALATAAFVLGPDKGLALLEGWNGAEGVLITDDGTVLTTSGIGEGGIKFEKR